MLQTLGGRRVALVVLDKQGALAYNEIPLLPGLQRVMWHEKEDIMKTMLIYILRGIKRWALSK
jgi:hypothetical protein